MSFVKKNSEGGKAKEKNIKRSYPFEDSPEGNSDYSRKVSLSELLRPDSMESYVGQEKILGNNTLLGKLLKKGEIINMILWGPPGCGKTSLVNVISRSTKRVAEKQFRFVKLCATSCGINDVREVVSGATKELKTGKRTIIFLREIHRFNKLQQDIFLPHLEAGTIILIGSTTENPSTSLNSALLSRCRIFELAKLSKEETRNILKRGISFLGGSILKHSEFSTKDLKNSNKNHSVPKVKFFLDEETVEWLTDSSNGDARIVLGALEIACESIISKTQEWKSDDHQKIPKLLIKDFKNSLERIHTSLNGKCDLKYDLLSALHKSIRGGDCNASVYWMARLMAIGEDPVCIARRLVRIASEEIGLADPEALDIAVQTTQACQMIGMPECDVMLSQCAIYMARALKSNSTEEAFRKAQRIIIHPEEPDSSTSVQKIFS